MCLYKTNIFPRYFLFCRICYTGFKNMICWHLTLFGERTSRLTCFHDSDESSVWKRFLSFNIPPSQILQTAQVSFGRFSLCFNDGILKCTRSSNTDKPWVICLACFHDSSQISILNRIISFNMIKLSQILHYLLLMFRNTYIVRLTQQFHLV